jgi:outer membrane protein OmpA-like peptidoglycan-associated protein
MIILVVGHTDDRGEREQKHRPCHLQRAEAVRNSISLKKSGAIGSDIKAEGKGPTEPVADNDHRGGQETQPYELKFGS